MRAVPQLKVMCFSLIAGVFATSCSPNAPGGHIIFLGYNPLRPFSRDLLMTDGDGNRLQLLGSFTSSPSWSPDGASIAVGCKGMSICILDARTIPDLRSYPQKSTRILPTIAREIDLSKSCPPVNGVHPRVRSISWSPDGTKLAVVCGPGMQRGKLCIIPMQGNIDCWNDDVVVRGDITCAVWSPRENILAVSAVWYTNRIYLVDPEGKNAVYLTDGWSPEWSPDGKQIAFITWAEGWSAGTLTGLAMIKKDGSGFRWLYQPPISPDTQDWPESYISFACEEEYCRLAWSPDGRFLAFSANHGWGHDMQIFRLDLKTKEIIFITNHMSSSYTAPDWGP